MASINQGTEQDHDFVELPDQDFYCPVSLEILLQPHQTSCCGHHFSQQAANRLVREGKPCPMCKAENFTTQVDKYFKRKINQLKVRCPHKKNGCDWVGELGDLDLHSNSCPKRPWKCQHCDFESTYEVGTIDHTPKCTKYPQPCPNKCEISTILRCDLKQHLLICPLQLVGCEFAHSGCDVKVPRRNLTKHMTENAQHHLMSATLLNLRLTRELHQKIEEKDQQIVDLQQHVKQLDLDMNTKLQQRTKDLDNKLQKQTRDIDSKLQQRTKDIDSKLQQQSRYFDGILQLHTEYLDTKLQQHTGVLESMLQQQTSVFDTVLSTKLTGVLDVLDAKLQQHTGILLTKLQQQTSEFDSKLQQQTGVFNSKLLQQTSNFDSKLQQQTGVFNSKLQQQTSDFDTVLDAKLQQQTGDFDSKLQKQTRFFDTNLRQQITELDDRLSLRSSGLYTSVEFISQGFVHHEFTLSRFKAHHAKGVWGSWHSNPFYSSPTGYQFKLNIDTKGCSDTHLSAYLYLLPGDYDKELKWPIKVTVSLEMLNQRGVHGNHKVISSMEYDRATATISSKTIGATQKFFPLDKLGYNAVRNTSYLKSDSINFRLYLKAV